MSTHSPRFSARTRLKVLAAAVLTALAGLSVGGEVLAQGWQWPWSQPEERRRPPQPPPIQQPYPGPSRQPPGYQPGPPPGAGPGGRSNICVQLEQQLVQEQQRGGQGREALPKLEADIRQYDRTFQQAQAQLERFDCYDSFFFSKTLKRTPRCLDLARQADDARRKLSELNLQRQQVMGTSGRSYQDDIIRELARNNCGAAYQQEANRRGGWSPFSGLWQDDDGGGGRGNGGFNLPFATYRTVCVRLCDGYFFPISFSTLPNHFTRDVDACQNRCAAPAELFYYQNPGGSIDQAISAKSQQPYSSLKTAFRYRKEFVQGCSCKEAEYVPSVSDGVPGPARRTDAPTQPPPNAPPRVRTATPDRTQPPPPPR